jgi:hypothetical protein
MIPDSPVASQVNFASLQLLEKQARELAANQTLRVSDKPGALIVAVQHLCGSGFSAKTMDETKSFQIGLNRSEQKTYQDQASHLLLLYLVWEWLNGIVYRSTNDSPIGRLRGTISDMWNRRPVNQTLDASDFLSGLKKGQLTYLLAIGDQPNQIPSPTEFHRLAIPVLAHWFGLDYKSRPKASYARMILSSPLGLDGFYLSPLVSAASNLAAQVLGIGRNCLVTDSRLDVWNGECLSKLPACQEGSQESVLVSQIANHMRRVFPLEKSLVDMVKVTMGDKPTMPPDLASTSKLSIPPLAAAPDPAMLLAMIHGLRPFLCPTYSRSGPAPSLEATMSRAERKNVLHQRFLARVHESTNQLLPFRNLANSRKGILQRGGPYSSENVRTKEGFFSALIYRGVTHNTRFLLENKTLFTSLEDWEAVCKPHAEAGEPPGYFCNVRAYGQPITTREVGNVVGYWSEVQKQTNTSWLTARGKIDPNDLFRLIKKFRGFGSLVAFQLTMDYVEAGMTTELTVEHMAKFIRVIKAGGIKGLEVLGYATSTEEEVAVALRSLQRSLVGKFSKPEREQMGYGLIFLEHSLCKVSRMNKQPYFSDWYQVV